MLYHMKDEENEREQPETEQNGNEEPIILDTEIETDWRVKRGPKNDSTTTNDKPQKK